MAAVRPQYLSPEAVAAAAEAAAAAASAPAVLLRAAGGSPVTPRVHSVCTRAENAVQAFGCVVHVQRTISKRPGEKSRKLDTCE